MNSPRPIPSRNSSYGSSLTSALTWTFSRLSRSRSQSPPLSDTAPSRELPPTYTPPPLPPLRITGYLPTTKTHLLSRALAEEIRILLPPRLQLHDTWTLTYSLEQHGVSLATLYKRAQEKRGAFVLVVKDSLGGIFGAFVNEPFRPSGRYYGTGECFLWRAVILPPPPEGSTPEPESGEEEDEEGNGGFSALDREQRIRFNAFPYSGINDYMILCESHFLSMGGGDGKYGLWLDDTFEKGVSSRCPTFGNEPLSDDTGGKFEILDVELWRVGT